MNEKPRSRRLSSVELLALAGLVLFLAYLAWMTLDAVSGDARTHAGRMRIPTIANNLRILENAKEEWALEHHATNGALPMTADLAPYLKGGEFPKPVAGELYMIKPVGELNTVTITKTLVGRFKPGEVFTVTNF